MMSKGMTFLCVELNNATVTIAIGSWWDENIYYGPILGVFCVTENLSKYLNSIKTFNVLSLIYVYLYNEQLLLMLRAYYRNSCHQKTKLHTNKDK